MAGPKPRPLKERFWAKVQKKGHGGCWIWTGGIARAKGKTYPAYSVREDGRIYGVRPAALAWELTTGSAPNGTLLSRCGNLFCVRPDHREFVEDRDAMRTKLYELRMRGLTLKEIGERVDLSPERVRQILATHASQTGQTSSKGAQVKALRARVLELEAALAKESNGGG